MKMNDESKKIESLKKEINKINEFIRKLDSSGTKNKKKEEK